VLFKLLEQVTLDDCFLPFFFFAIFFFVQTLTLFLLGSFFVLFVLVITDACPLVVTLPIFATVLFLFLLTGDTHSLEDQSMSLSSLDENSIRICAFFVQIFVEVDLFLTLLSTIQLLIDDSSSSAMPVFLNNEILVDGFCSSSEPWLPNNFDPSKCSALRSLLSGAFKLCKMRFKGPLLWVKGGISAIVDDFLTLGRTVENSIEGVDFNADRKSHATS
jgi:hypothetical protein